MIKSKLRLFGWAVGLSLALGAVGAVAAQGAPVETKAGVHPTNSHWTQISDASDLGTSGTYIFTVPSNDKYLGGTTSSGHFPVASSSIGADAPDKDSNGAITLESITDTSYFKIKVKTGASTYKYLTASAAKSGSGALSDSDSYGWSFVYDSTEEGFYCVYQKSGANAHLRAYNNANWRTYANDSNGTVWNIYQYIGDPSLTIDPSSATIYTSGETTSVDVDLSWMNFSGNPTITVETDDASVIPTSKVEIEQDNPNKQALAVISNNGKNGVANITFTAAYGDDEEDSASIEVTVIDNSLSLSKIEATEPTKTAYAEDDPLDLTGLVVTATFSDNSTLDVTAQCEFSIADGTPLKTTDTTLNIDYTYLGVKKSTSVALTISPYQAATYTKVVTTPDDWRGTYLIVYESGKVAFDGSRGTSNIDAEDNTISVNPSAGSIAGSKAIDACTFAIGQINSASSEQPKHYLRSASGLYIGRNSNSNGMDKDSATKYELSLSIDDSANFVVTSSAAPLLRFNSASNQNRFRFFKSGQQAVQLYKSNKDATTEANAYASGFLSATNVCDPSGQTNNITSQIWTAQGNAFNALSGNAQYLIAHADAIASDDPAAYEAAEDYVKAVTRYNHIIQKYESQTIDDFMDRVAIGKATSGAGAAPYRIGSSNNQALIVALVGGLGLVAAGGLVLLSRKRKEN